MTSLYSRAVAAAIVLALSGCGGAERNAEVSQSDPVKVRTTSVERLAGLSYSEVMGTIVARKHADIQTKVQARVESIPVAIGTKVRQGDLLVEFDTRETRARLKQARAVTDQATEDLTRYETLLSAGAVTKQEYDGMKTRKDVAEAGLQEAEAMLTYARITAPFSGTIIRKDISEGELAVPGRPLFTLEDESSLQLVVSLPESQRGMVANGNTFTVTADPYVTVPAVVEELSTSADPVSRSLTAKLSLPSGENLHPGQVARLLLPAGHEAGLALPASAVVRRGQLELVFAVSDDNRALLKLVRTGRTLGDKVEILSGLRGEERIIIDPPNGLGDHDPVEVQP